jgi:hypothetical protein
MTFSLISGVSYRLANETKLGNCMLHKGEVVIYSSGGYSPYDDCYIHHFVNTIGEKLTCSSRIELTEVETENFKSASQE